MSPKHIEELLDSDDRYEVSSVAVLEDFLQEQLRDGSYDLDANLAILKLYLLYPDESKVDVLQDILLKALMAFPSPDFSLCMYQIPEKQQTSVQPIVDLAQQLEMAKFKTFWKLAAETERLVAIKDWQGAVRKFIIGVVSATHRSIKREELLELLNVADAELEKLAKEQGWTASKENKDVLVVNTHTFDTKKAKEPTSPRTFSMERYTKLFSAAAA